ncbi:hypothetical protein [Sinorhizobium fredii]|uniref:Uncharacterized protein n=1 Tax=Rhizobium fredii TaxID=380 RepID=A0A2L0HAA1_RHIFR|nr:hypothetical protein [Sinorhizobium fredii]AUX78426.1 hypothetical protein NXT3_PA00134 [Sinorhizobium fredii]
MHQNAIIAVAATPGLAAGAGGTYIANSDPKVEAPAISKAELVRLSPPIRLYARFRPLKRLVTNSVCQSRAFRQYTASSNNCAM